MNQTLRTAICVAVAMTGYLIGCKSSYDMGRCSAFREASEELLHGVERIKKVVEEKNAEKTEQTEN